MNKKSLLISSVIILFAVMIASAHAKITASIQVKDLKGDALNNSSVHLNAQVIVYGHYEDQTGSSAAAGKIEIYLDKGQGFKYVTTLWTGTVQDGQTITSPTYTLTEIGMYQFRWTIQIDKDTAPCTETAQARTTVYHTPEPATLAALMTGLSTLGLLAYKRRRK